MYTKQCQRRVKGIRSARLSVDGLPFAMWRFGEPL